MRRFFDAVFGDIPDQMSGLVWTLAGKESHWFQTPEDGFEVALKQPSDTYCGVGLAPLGRKKTERCPADELLGLLGFVADIDIDGPAHKKITLPPNEDAAKNLVLGHGFDPTILVHSGHGLQAWWLFKEPWIFEAPEERDRAKNLSFRLHSLIKSRALKNGWNLDSVYDLARVMRIPGTWNCKNGKKVKAQLLEIDNSRRWEPSDLDAILPPAEIPTVAVVQAATELKLDPNATINMVALASIAAFEPRLLATWDGSRTDLASNSEIDMALAALLSQAEWTDQEIANALIHRRREYQQNPQKALRADYITRTILKARSGQVEKTTIDGIEQATTIAGTEYEPLESREHNLRLISNRLKITIERIIKYVQPKPIYALQISGVIIEVGIVENLISNSKLQARIAESSGYLIPLIKGNKEEKGSGWHSLAQLLLSSCEEVSVTEASTVDKQTAQWLGDFILHQTEIEPACELADSIGTRAIFLYGGEMFFSFAKFRQWLFISQGEQVDNQALSRRLKNIGSSEVGINYYMDKKRCFKRGWKAIQNN